MIALSLKPRVQIAVLACAAACTMATNYLLQPLLPTIIHAFSLAPASAGFISGAPQVGYMIGLVVLVPLSDQVETRLLMLFQGFALSAALLIGSAAPTAGILVAGGVIGGAMATVAAQCIALSARLMPDSPGRAVGTVATGVFVGILTGRVIGGALGEALGWRGMLAAMAATTLAVTTVIAIVVPRMAPTRALDLSSTIRAVPIALLHQPLLRRYAAAGAIWFAAFCGFWAVLALHLASPPFLYGSQAIGAFGFLGIIGALGAQFAGRAVDRICARKVILLALTGSFLSLGLMLAAGKTLAGMIVGTIVFDVGMFAAQAANQVRVLKIEGARQSGIYGAYMVIYYVGGAIGASLGPTVFEHFGWVGLCLTGNLLLAAALAIS